MSFRGFTAFTVLAASLASAPPVGAEAPPEATAPDAVHEVIVALAPGTTVDDLVVDPADAASGVAELQLAPSAGSPDEGVVEAVVDNVGTDGDWVSLQVDDEGLAALESSDLVSSVSPNHEITLALDQSVPAVGAATTPALGFDGSGTTVVIVDTGVDATHPALAGSIVAEACFESSLDLTCPGGATSSTAPGSGAPCDVMAAAECGHGTHVAGIVAGRASPRGVAPGAGIVSVRIFRAGPGGQAFARPDDLTLAMEWVRDNHSAWGAVAVNLSLGFEVSPFSGSCDFFAAPLVAAMSDLRAAGVASVVASGNAGADPLLVNGVYPPACYSAATPVSATYSTGGMADFAHRSGVVELVAPGATSPSAGILSAAVGGGTTALFGTSMAAPHVAGMFALLREAEPSLSVAQVEDRLRDSGIPVPDPYIDRSYAQVRADRALCNVPRRVGCAQAGAGDGAASVEWRNLTAPDRGVVEHRVTLDDGSPPVVLPASAIGHTVTGLTNGEPYSFLVEALGPGQAVLASATSNTVVPKPPAGPHGFVDVPDGAFYAPGVRWARAEGVTTGVGGSTAFAPDAVVTRAEMVTFLWRMADQPTGHPPHGFPDVRPGVYYDQAVAWARATGITTGVGGTGTFRPDLPVSRAELVTFLWRFVGAPTGYLPDRFVDTATGAFYDSSVRWAAFHGVTTGVGGSATFAPTGPVSRGESVTFLRRAAADPAAWDQGALVPSTVVF